MEKKFRNIDKFSYDGGFDSMTTKMARTHSVHFDNSTYQVFVEIYQQLKECVEVIQE